MSKQSQTNQKNQQNKATSQVEPGNKGFVDKKLNGPNRPST